MLVEVCNKTLRGLNTAWLHTPPLLSDVKQSKTEKPLLLLLHGFPDTPESWDKQIECFGSQYEVVAPYVRGATPSEATKDINRYTTDSIGLDVLQILEEVDPTKTRPVLVVGHDLGAVHAWSVARLLKNRAAGLVVLNGYTIKQMARRLQQPRQLLKSWYMFAAQVPVLPELVMRHFPRSFLKKAHFAGGLSATNEPSLDLCAKAVTGPLNQYRAFFRQLPKAMMTTTKRLRCPVLVIFGSDDAFLVPPTMEEFEADAADLTVRIVSGNHWLHREQAAEINNLLAEFFAHSLGKGKMQKEVVPHEKSL